MNPVLREEIEGLRKNIKALLNTIDEQAIEIERLRRRNGWEFLNGVANGFVIGVGIALWYAWRYYGGGL